MSYIRRLIGERVTYFSLIKKFIKVKSAYVVKIINPSMKIFSLLC